MAISAFKTFASGEILTASDLNSSFTQIINNPIALWSPMTANASGASTYKLTALTAGTTAGDSLMYGQALVGSTLTLTGAVSGATTIAMGGALSGVTTLTMSGLLSGSTGTFTGLVSGITPTSNANFAIKSYVDGVAFTSALPGINSGTNGSLVSNDGVSSAWVSTVAAESYFYME